MLAFVAAPLLAMLGSLLVMSAGVGCSPQTNLLGRSTPASQRQGSDVTVALGRAYLDDGAISEAYTFALQAYTRNPASEEAATLLGFVYLAQAGVTPFTLAKQMIANKNATKKDEGGETSSALGGLGPVIGLNSADFALLGTLNSFDPELPVIEPICADEARLLVSKLDFVNRAIAVICPFVASEILLALDSRHQCQSLTTPLPRQNQAHFLWALAHLVEAAAFQEVINYATVTTGKSNLELRAAKVQSLGASIATNPTGISAFVMAMDNFGLTLSRVLQVSDSCSPEFPQTQLLALVNDLTSVSYAFGHMQGIPPAMTKSIDKAMASLQQLQEKTAGASKAESQSNAIKSDVTKKMARSLGAAIAGIDQSSYSPEQIDQVCSSYDEISGHLADDPNRPELCNAASF